MEYNVKFDIAGRVLEVGETQTFGSGFTKRNVIIEGSKNADKFSNPIQLTFKQEACVMADSLKAGDGIRVDGFIEGRRWEKDGTVRHFLDLSVRSVVVTEKAAKPTDAASWGELLALSEYYGEGKDALVGRCKALGKAFKDMAEADWHKLAAEVVAAHAESAPDRDVPAGADDMPF